MPALQFPPDIEAVLSKFYTCELTTVNKAGQPITWPTLPYYNQSEGTIVLAASIAFPTKTYNARRHPQVSLLYSDPMGSKLPDPPAVLVQGDATVMELVEEMPWTIDLFKTSVRRQPDSRKYIANPIARKLFEFYFQRIGIVVTPRRVLVWPHLDFSAAPTEVEVRYVD